MLALRDQLQKAPQRYGLTRINLTGRREMMEHSRSRSHKKQQTGHCGNNP
jgi:hypothetical protein